jgi:hypothetical protein
MNSHTWVSVLGSFAVAVSQGCSTDGSDERENALFEDEPEEDLIRFEQAKLLIEHNATDEDTGFQAFVDGEPWNDLSLAGPDGRKLLRIKGQSGLAALGLTELFFETNEPENAEVPIDSLLEMMPEGEYELEGRSVDGIRMTGAAVLTHAIPEGPQILSPADEAMVSPDRLVVRWSPVTHSLSGTPVTIAAYQVIVEKDAPPHPNAFAHIALSVHLPPSITSVTVPREFLEPGTSYKLEVFAIEESGNQTLSSITFETE